MRGFLQNIALLGVSCVLALLAGELTLRLLGFHGASGATLGRVVPVDDDVLDYRLQPGITWVNQYGIERRTNSKGWVDEEHDYAKEPGVYRVVMLGDSVLEGYGVRPADTFGEQLERRLNEAKSRRFEAIRLAMGALNTEQEAHLLEVEGMKYDPDLVVVGFVLNDSGGGFSVKQELASQKKPTLRRRVKEAIKSSAIFLQSYRAIERLAWRMQFKFGVTDSQDKIIRDNYYDRVYSQAKNWRRVQGGFEKIASLCGPRGIPVVVVIFPVFHELQEYRWRAIHERVRNAAADQGFLVLDLLPVYQPEGAKDVRIGWGDYIHPNERGHQLAGDALYDFLAERVLADAGT